MHGNNLDLAILSLSEQSQRFSVINCSFLNIVITESPITLPAGHNDIHHQYEFLIPMTHISRLFIEEKEIDCCPGFLVPINPGQIHGVKHGHSQASFIMAFFDQDRMDNYIQEIYGDVDCGFPAEALPLKNEIQMLISDMVQENRTSETGREMLLQNMAEQLAILLIRHYYRTTAAPELIKPEQLTDEQLRFQDVITFMHENFGARLTVEQLAGLTVMNTFYFIRSFKRCFNISPYNYLTKIRINNAKHLLAHTRMSTAEIGRLCGFHSASRFSAVFQKDSGQTPSYYRKTAQPRLNRKHP